MRIYIIASNIYTHVCPLNVHLTNKYWPGQDITLLGYEELEKLDNFPDNVSVEILGKQDDFGGSWSDAIIPYFQNVSEDYFVVNMDDVILLNQVDTKRMDRLEKKMQSGEAQKAVIGGGLPLELTTRLPGGLLAFNEGIDYRCTLHPSIWAKEYFLKYLKPNMTPWDFEVRNNRIAMYDGAQIITDDYDYPREPHPFSCLNLYRRKGGLTIDAEGNVLPHGYESKIHFDKDELRFIWRQMNAS